MPGLIDESGKRYGMLRVIERAGSNIDRNAAWKCICDCGNETIVIGYHLRVGHTRSCGCQVQRAIDETGNRYGRLMVIERAENSKSGNAAWLCKCDCGREKTVKGVDLRIGDVKSCGNKGCRSPFHLGDASKRKALSSIRRNEEIRGYPFEIDDDYAILLMESQCYYCEALPMNRLNGKNSYGDCLYNGIDRYDNEPYVRYENAVPCCGTCNLAKNNKFTGDEFKEWRQRVGPTNYD